MLNQGKWWELKEVCNNKTIMHSYPYENCKDKLTMFFFSEKSFESQSKLHEFVVKG